MSQLHDLSAAEQLRALRGGELTSRELTEHYLDRITKLDAELGAFVTVDPELALRNADRTDERLTRGEHTPLGGIPIGIKDLHATAGLATSFGSAALAGHVPTDDDWTVGLIRRAGAVVVGKTNAPEFGVACYVDAVVTPVPAVTPYDTGRYSSGSSGGAATAVAAGLLPIAHASDGAGSTRTPAAACHLVGIKPSRGLVSLAPASSFLATGAEGPLARTVEDAALLLEVMAQPPAQDLYGWTPDTSLAEAGRTRPDRPLKIGWWTDTGLAGVDPHPESVRAVRRTVDLLRGLGHEVREIAPPARQETAAGAISDMLAVSATMRATMQVPADKRDLLTAHTRNLAAVGAKMTGPDVLLMHAALARFASDFLAGLDDFDVALTPTTSGPPVPLGHFEADGIERVNERMLAWSCYTPWANLTGQPAVSLPSHLDDDGLPYSVQLVGRIRQDATLVSLAAQLEHEGLWDAVHPPHWFR
ncbi:amidase [Nocardioides panzhihuensis]|uniref:Amidase n=1 Tax=Nocardioides panzhihuensis TaxID=860243 RepID=A0A7Z0DLK4_9ACTN|nr:amidase [Nocardioides panzhihuensis]NYI77670.1 amidase [Nocardioides panzhihuensis]